MLLCLSEIKQRASNHEDGALHHALPVDLLAEGEGESVCCCSDLVLCLHVGHVFCIGVTNGHNPVAHTNTSLSCLPTWGQLEGENRGRRRT